MAEQDRQWPVGRLQRVSLVGVSGAGKTTVGRKLATSLGVPFVELDAIFHQPDWVELPRDDFRERVGAALVAPGWVVDGNYSAPAAFRRSEVTEPGARERSCGPATADPECPQS